MWLYHYYFYSIQRWIGKKISKSATEGLIQVSQVIFGIREKQIGKMEDQDKIRDIVNRMRDNRNDFK